jgi:hypothetical protein
MKLVLDGIDQQAYTAISKLVKIVFATPSKFELRKWD